MLELQIPLDPFDPAHCWSHLYLKGFSDAVMRTAVEVSVWMCARAVGRTDRQVEDMIDPLHCFSDAF